MTRALLGERYRLDHLIGRGGMAAVWSATDTVLGRRVAVKRLHAGMLDDPDHAERFRREAMLVARLSHPNLVHLLDRGDDPDGPYLVMELVEGENLKSLVRREGALEPDEAARVCALVGRALAYAHGQGVVHRDIKGQNVLITSDRGVKLADFGIARLMEADGQEGLTRTDVLMGSADYLSPEQADGRPVDGRTDVYSLGILLYECLTGRLPFRGEGFVAVAMKHCSDPLPDPRAAAPAVPDWLASCVMRAAAKDPGDRFPSAAAMVAALDEHQMSTTIMPAVPAAVDEDTGRASRPNRRRRRALLAALAVAIAAGATTGAVLLTDEGSRPPPAVVAAGPLPIAAVRDYDPEGDDGAQSPENPDQRGLAVDRDPATAWYTEKYRGSPGFGGLKTGVGLILRLVGPAVASQMVVSSPTPGAGFEVLGPLVDGRRQVLATGTFAGGEQAITLARAAPAEAYVLWITSLVDDGGGGFWAGVGQVEMRGVPNST